MFRTSLQATCSFVFNHSPLWCLKKGSDCMSSWNGEIELAQWNIITASKTIAVKTRSCGKDACAVLKKTRKKSRMQSHQSFMTPAVKKCIMWTKTSSSLVGNVSLVELLMTCICFQKRVWVLYNFYSFKVRRSVINLYKMSLFFQMAVAHPLPLSSPDLRSAH